MIEFLCLSVLWCGLLRGICFLLDSYGITSGMVALFDMPLFPEKETDLD
jgi:hypothetical protein